MNEKEKYEMYERCIPKYLKHDIEEYLKYKDDPKCTVKDCLIDEIYGSINSALYSEEIDFTNCKVEPTYLYSCSKGKKSLKSL